jgi:hypothetical protein
MAKERRENQSLLDGIAGAAREAGARGLPPVHLWNPPYCGELDIRIAADGTWFYLGTPIGRPALVRLFASVLKREGDRYFLVTPVEKVGIIVEDAPFLAVEMSAAQPAPDAQTSEMRTGELRPLLHFRTNMDEHVTCDAEHPLRFEPQARGGGLTPYLHVRANLWAKVTRAVYYDLVARGEDRRIEGRDLFGVASGAHFFPMADADSLKDVT